MDYLLKSWVSNLVQYVQKIAYSDAYISQVCNLGQCLEAMIQKYIFHLNSQLSSNSLWSLVEN